MRSLNDLAIAYGQQVEALLERLGAGGPVRGAGELLDQVKHLLNPSGLRTVRRFLRLRNRVVHGKPVEMPLPSWEALEQAGRAAVGVLEEALAARKRQTRTPGGQSTASPKERTPQKTPPPVYRIWERSGAYEVWVGPAGVWVGAGTREALERARLEVEARLAARFPRLTVREVLLGKRGQQEALAARIRYGQQWLSPEEVYAVTRLLTKPVQNEGQQTAQTRAASTQSVRPSQMRTVRLKDIPAAFYVGPVGVLAVAEHPLIAETEAKRVWEDSGGAISAVPVVRAPALNAPEGRVQGVLALRDEAAIRRYLLGKHVLDEDEVVQVAGWLGNRQAPVPQIRDKAGRYRLQGEALAEARLEAPPVFGVELVPPGPPPNPLMLRLASLLGALRR